MKAVSAALLYLCRLSPALSLARGYLEMAATIFPALAMLVTSSLVGRLSSVLATAVSSQAGD